MPEEYDNAVEKAQELVQEKAQPAGPRSRWVEWLALICFPVEWFTFESLNHPTGKPSHSPCSGYILGLR